MLESDRLVCENKHNLSLNAIWDPSIYVYFNYKVNLLIGREKIFATISYLMQWEPLWEVCMAEFRVISRRERIISLLLLS